MIVELRTYTLQAGKVQPWLDHYEKNGLPTQQRMLGQLIGFFRSEIGVQNQLTHLWAYESLADREARRAAMQQDPQWKDDAGMKDFDALIAKYLPDANRVDSSMMTGYNMALTMVALLKTCGDDLTRANIMKQAANIKDLEIAGLLPGIKINTSPTDFAPISQLQTMRFDNGRWQLFGEVISGDVAK